MPDQGKHLIRLMRKAPIGESGFLFLEIFRLGYWRRLPLSVLSAADLFGLYWRLAPLPFTGRGWKLCVLPASAGPGVSRSGRLKRTPRKQLLEFREALLCAIQRRRATPPPKVRIARAPAAHKTRYLPSAIVPNRQIRFRFRCARARKISCHRFLEMSSLMC